MEEDEVIGLFCFDKETRLNPLTPVDIDYICDDYEELGNNIQEQERCLNCRRSAYVKRIAGKLCKMHAMREPVSPSNPNIPKDERLYSKSGKTWCRKTSLDSANELFKNIEKMKEDIEIRDTINVLDVDEITKNEIKRLLKNEEKWWNQV